MCAAFTLRPTVNEILEGLKLRPVPAAIADSIKPMAFPKSEILIFEQGDAGIAARSAFWSLVPKGQDPIEFTKKYSTHNAKIETISEKFMYAKAWKAGQRIVIPASGFYEWRGEKGKKEKLHIHDPKGLMFIGGIASDTAEGRKTATMLTCGPNSFMEPLHHRMPVILADWRRWLDPKLKPDEALSHAVPYAGQLEFEIAKK